MLLLLAGIQFGLLAAPPPDVGAWKSRLAAAIQQAVAANPDLSAMEARIEASRQRVLQSDAFPDPEVEVGIKDLPVASPSLTRDDFTMEMVSARQRLPGAGKRAARRASAEAASTNALALHEVHAAEIAAEVADVFFAIADLDRRLEILDRSRERLKTTAASATERYRVGKGTQSDVLRANLQTTALEERFIALKSERRVLSARFNSLQKLPVAEPVPPIGPLDPLPSVPDPLAIQREAEERSAALRAARATVRRAEEELRLAKLERRPDWTISTYYGRREKFEDLAGASVSFNLPFAHPRRLEAKRAEMEAELSSVRADLEAVRNQISRDIEAAAAELERNVEQERLYRSSILPQAEITFRAARESYAVGQIDFETYVRAALDLDNYESEHATRAAGIGRALAALQKASGLPLIEGTPTPGDRHVEK
jgi:outer membrane protein, heavy metal efflux system